MIGVYDSGIGGLSVWRELRTVMLSEDYAYFSDSANCPYGNKPIEFIVRRADIISRFLIDEGADMVVVACNTATAAAIGFLRSKYSIPFIGMEPAIKPAVLTSETGVVGVLATANTFKGALYHNTLERFASKVKVIERVGDGLVELVENGVFNGEKLDTLLHTYIDPMVEQNVDAIVLGCTHYPFLSDAISSIAGPNVKIINPAPAVAKQAQNIYASISHKQSLTHKQAGGNTIFYSTSDDLNIFKRIVRSIDSCIGENCFKTINI